MQLPNAKFPIQVTLILSIAFIVFIRSGNDSNAIENVSSSGEAGLITYQTIKVAGEDREYHLFLPAQRRHAPVVFLFHSHIGNFDELIGREQRRGGAPAPFRVWLDIAAKENIILVIPNGRRVSHREKGWNDCRADAASNSTADDVLFTNRLLDFVLDNHDADQNRVYATGVSNGGHFCIRLAQEMPHRLAAFASVVAANAVNCECYSSTIPVSAMFINGTADPILPYTGGTMASERGEVFSTAESIDYWVERNETKRIPEGSVFPDLAQFDRSRVMRYAYHNEPNQAEVVLLEVINAGHTMPSIQERNGIFAPMIVGKQNADIEMAEQVWDFFSDKTKFGSTSK